MAGRLAPHLTTQCAGGYAETAVAEAVDPSVDSERATARPRFLNNGRLAHVAGLFDHIQLAESLCRPRIAAGLGE